MLTPKELGPSSSNTRWILKEISTLALNALSQQHQLSARLTHLLLNREINPEEFEEFLNPTLAHSTPDPFHLIDMKKGVNRVIQALKAKEKITVFGDYDVDGATSAASLILFFRALNHTLDFYIPHREKEGYGPNKEALTKIKEQGTSLVITVDCGATSFEALEHAKHIGLDVIVLDHHLGSTEMPACTALINPNRHDESSPCTYLAAAGVTFLFLIALRKGLRDQHWFQEHEVKEPKLSDILPLTALGTVCDVMALKDFNRTLVKQGLKALEHTQNPGIQALLKESALSPPYQAYHFGFILGPRINAAGRIDDASMGTRLLTHPQQDTITKTLAEKLSLLNQERQSIEKAVLERALKLLEKEAEEHNFICLSEKDWPPGVIGLVAGRLKERFHKPTFIITLDETGKGKGSARSIKGFDIGSCIQSAVKKGLLTTGGGHPMAGGFSLEAKNIHSFKEFLKTATLNLNRQKILEIDQVLSLEAVTSTTFSEIEQLEPFGPGNPRPVFLFKECTLKHVDIMGKDHLRLTLSNGFGSTKTALLFKAFDSPLGPLLLESIRKKADVVGSLKTNTYQGRTSLQILVEDVKIHT